VIHDSSISMEVKGVRLQDGINPSHFPVLKRFCIPLEKFWLNGILPI